MNRVSECLMYGAIVGMEGKNCIIPFRIAKKNESQKFRLHHILSMNMFF